MITMPAFDFVPTGSSSSVCGSRPVRRRIEARRRVDVWDLGRGVAREGLVS